MTPRRWTRENPHKVRNRWRRWYERHREAKNAANLRRYHERAAIRRG